MKRIIKIPLFFFLATVFLLGSAFYVVNIYTSAKAKDLGGRTAKHQYTWWGDGNPELLKLGDLLKVNIYTQLQTTGQQFPVGYSTPESYKNGWRLLAVNNPKTTLAAVGTYAPTFITAYEAGLKKENISLRAPDAEWKSFGKFYIGSLAPDSLKEDFRVLKFTYPDAFTLDSFRMERVQKWAEWRRDSIAREENLRNFTTKKYWAEQKVLIEKYRRLISVMSALPDTTLNSYIAMIYAEQNSYNYDEPATEVHQFLVKKKIISQLPETSYQPGIWHIGEYPLDFLFLTARIFHDYPQKWPPRRFLGYASSALQSVEKNVPK